MRVGLLGGTFDPVHYGHLRLAEVVRDDCGLDRVWFIPCGRPSLEKEHCLSSGEDRYAMTLLAAGSARHFDVLRLEIDRPGPSYTIETVEELQREGRDSADFLFIMGADSLRQLPLWHRYHDLLERCRLIVVNRPGYPAREAGVDLTPAQRSRISAVTAEGLAISSTDLRARVRARRSIRYLTPDAVIDYIDKRRLYQSDVPAEERER